MISNCHALSDHFFGTILAIALPHKPVTSRRERESDMDQILTANEAADYLKVTVRTIYRLIRKGKIPGCKVGGSWRFRRDILDDWLAGSQGIFPEFLEKTPTDDAG